MINRRGKEGLFVASCVLPGLLVFGFFILFPTVRVFVKSLYEWSGIGEGGGRFIGLANFKDAFSDRILRIAFANTGFLMAVVPAGALLLALVFASILTQSRLRERNLYRTVFFFPSILSFVIIAILFSFVLHPTMGILNSLLGAVGLGKFAYVWLGDRHTVMWAIAATMVWQASGYYMVMYMAGIDSISRELYEAAGIDGATAFQQFFRITIPQLWEIIRVTIIFAINGAIVISFPVVMVMTDGGPDRYSEVVLTQMYKQAFGNANFGYAMAIAVIVFAVSVLLSLVSNRLTKREAW
jgi:N-acetylglucosamine transport system permease protein